MTGDRDKIYARIREALREPAPRHHDAPMRSGAPTATAEFRAWLPHVGPDFTDRVALFAKQSDALKSEFLECADAAAAAAHIASLAESNDWKQIALHPGELTDAVANHLPAGLARFPVAGGYDKFALEKCDAGLTECETLIAQTGSVCVTSRSSGGRALSVVPPHHIVLARRAQLIPDLTAAYEHLAKKYGASYPSFISFISGPSRTGDIERILVLGAHGPKKLTILLLP